MSLASKLGMSALEWQQPTGKLCLSALLHVLKLVELKKLRANLLVPRAGRLRLTP